MTTRLPAWVIVLVFSLVHLLVSVAFLALATHETLAFGKSSPAVIVSFWVLALPLAVADKCGLSVPPLLFLPNSLLYGILWWFMWRMVRLLFPRRPAD